MLGSTLCAKLISLMARQLHLTKNQFLDLIDCPLDEEGYRAILRKSGNDGQKKNKNEKFTKYLLADCHHINLIYLTLTCVKCGK